VAIEDEGGGCLRRKSADVDALTDAVGFESRCCRCTRSREQHEFVGRFADERVAGLGPASAFATRESPRDEFSLARCETTDGEPGCLECMAVRSLLIFVVDPGNDDEVLDSNVEVVAPDGGKIRGSQNVCVGVEECELVSVEVGGAAFHPGELEVDLETDGRLADARRPAHQEDLSDRTVGWPYERGACGGPRSRDREWLIRDPSQDLIGQFADGSVARVEAPIGKVALVEEPRKGDGIGRPPKRSAPAVEACRQARVVHCHPHHSERVADDVTSWTAHRIDNSRDDEAGCARSLEVFSECRNIAGLHHVPSRVVRAFWVAHADLVRIDVTRPHTRAAEALVDGPPQCRLPDARRSAEPGDGQRRAARHR
jgi:hypothetical protein